MLLPLDGMLVRRRVTPAFCQVFPTTTGTHLYTWVERGTLRVKCLSQEHNVLPRPGLESRPFDSESIRLAIGLHLVSIFSYFASSVSKEAAMLFVNQLFLYNGAELNVSFFLCLRSFCCSSCSSWRLAARFICLWMRRRWDQTLQTYIFSLLTRSCFNDQWLVCYGVCKDSSLAFHT